MISPRGLRINRRNSIERYEKDESVLHHSYQGLSKNYRMIATLGGCVESFLIQIHEYAGKSKLPFMPEGMNQTYSQSL